MISFDTFSGPRERVREAELDAHGLLGLAEQTERALPVLFPPPADAAPSEAEEEAPDSDAGSSVTEEEAEDFYESQDEDCDLFHEKSACMKAAELQKTYEPEAEAEAVAVTQSEDDGDSEASGGRIQRLVELLTLKSHNVGDARSALVRKLLGVVNLDDLLLSKATEEQIACAANDAITDELLASVSQEEARREALALADAQQRQLVPSSSAPALFQSGPLSPFRVLELVDVLDSSTGGMVKLVLTKVRRRAPFGSRLSLQDADANVEFCRFCAAYGDHTAAQHRCRLCGVAGHHRSRRCPYADTTLTTTSTATSGVRASANTGQRYCTLCSAWGLHDTERHRCRTCGRHGVHRSRSCPQASSASSSRAPWIGSPVNSQRELTYCSLCGAWRPHASAAHRCRLCGALGDHRSANCPNDRQKQSKKTSESLNSSATGNPERSTALQRHGDDTSPSRSPEKTRVDVLTYCSFCRKRVTHPSNAHMCRVCRAVGAHRSDACPLRPAPSSNIVLAYSVDAASKVRDHVLEKLPQVLPPSAAALVWRSLDKVGDADLILRKTLHRLGVWGGGSQTPITTPYAPPVEDGDAVDTTSPGHDSEALQLLRKHHPELISPSSSSSSSSAGPVTLDDARASGVYVLSYAEGGSVVPARILKYMRLLMHHEVSTNAFSVVVRFDPRPSHWELMKPGMVSPRSLPTSPTMSRQLRQRMAHYTLQTLLGARDKLRELVTARRKLQQRLQRQQELEAHNQEPGSQEEEETSPQEQQRVESEPRRSSVECSVAS